MIKTDNEIGDEGAGMISEVLKSNSTLTTLYLNCERTRTRRRKKKKEKREE